MRLVGVDLPKNKRVVIALTYIYGIGRTTANKIVQKAGIPENKRVQDLTDEEIAKIRNATSEYKLEGALRSEIAMNIKRLIEVHSYRGMRHLRGLPVRGQRTRTNARTKRGKRKTIGGVKAATAKT
jgi:small subunit ribosomal protein S13